LTDTRKPKDSTWDWRYSVGGWNIESSENFQTIPFSSVDFSPETVAIAIAEDLLLQEDTLICLTEAATGKRYEIMVAAHRVIEYTCRTVSEIEQSSIEVAK
jgi:hypothetical protein